jgi:phage tail sheath protein FI
MGFQVSPGVNVSEIDLTTIIPAVSTTTGAFAGHFNWGPANQRVLVDSEDTLVKNFRTPQGNTYVDFFTAANFLAYGNALYVVRVVNESGTKSSNTARARNAVSNTAGFVSGNSQNTIIFNEDDYDANYSSGISGVGPWVAKYPGVLGDAVRISICPTANAFTSTISGTASFTNNSVSVNFTTAAAVSGKVVPGDILVLGPDRQTLKVASVSGNVVTLQSKYVGNTGTQATTTRRWEFFDYFSSAPGTSEEASRYGSSNDELHVVVADRTGNITGTANTILEVWPSLSKAADVKSEDGTNINYRNYINKNSRWVWWTAHSTGITNAGKSVASRTNFGVGTQSRPINTNLCNGRDGASPRAGDYINGYNKFRSSEDVDVSLILGGGQSTSTVPVHIINNITEYRKDCIAVFSPREADVVNNSGYAGSEVDDIVTFRNQLPSTSYAVIDSGWKYQYDKYSDRFRYVPCNGDTAGTMVRTDIERDPWYSPAGYNRGQIKNVIKLAFNPNKSERDVLYKNGINPITTFPGEGTILFGDKTLLTKPSAFDRINVRRLFIVLEKAIATAAKYTLFEFNDAFTRAQFKALVEPFLRDVQGRRGITDFRVVCDETNNTPEVVDRNEFIGDIYIKPARSINFIQLNFVAVRTGVDFTEVVGKF